MIAFCDQCRCAWTIRPMVQSMFTAAYREVVQTVVRVRTDAGLTQRALAHKLGREQSYVGRIETGQRRLDIVEFVWICKVCGADPVVATQGLLKSIAPHTSSRRKSARSSV
jgi:transcriptional regulator with XRE-family HTH domain